MARPRQGELGAYCPGQTEIASTPPLNGEIRRTGLPFAKITTSFEASAEATGGHTAHVVGRNVGRSDLKIILINNNKMQWRRGWDSNPR